VARPLSAHARRVAVVRHNCFADPDSWCSCVPCSSGLGAALTRHTDDNTGPDPRPCSVLDMSGFCCSRASSLVRPRCALDECDGDAKSPAVWELPRATIHEWGWRACYLGGIRHPSGDQTSRRSSNTLVLAYAAPALTALQKSTIRFSAFSSIAQSTWAGSPNSEHGRREIRAHPGPGVGSIGLVRPRCR